MNAFGIDLGTTNSVISWLVAGRPQAIAIDGSPIVPSIVLYRDGEVVVGREARNLALLHPDRTVTSVKRLMGRQPSLAVGGRNVRPEEVSAAILRALKTGAELATGMAVSDVVVTVPAWFDEAQRRATLEAAELAQLRVLRLINEPTASSMVYDQAADLRDEPHTVLVYDLGGGTFDVSVLDVFGEVREVKATSGDTHLGGDDFDRLLVGILRQHLQAAHRVDVRGDPVAMARLQRVAEETKIALSADTSTHAHAEFIATRDGKPVHLDLEVRRTEFEDLIRPHLERTVRMALDAVTAAGLQPSEIAKVCLVGGSTRIPLVRLLLAEAFEADVHEEIDVDLAVSLGAAVQAAVLQGQPVERILVDVTAHDLGVRAVGSSYDDDHFAAVIHRNTVLPTERVREFYTMNDNQSSVDVDVFQGNSDRCPQNRLIGTFNFKLKPAPAGSPVRAELAYDLNGMVRVSVLQPGLDNARTVAMRIADATEAATAPQAAPIAASTVQRKAAELRERLTGSARDVLEALVAAYVAAPDGQRLAAEEALLDFFIDHDA